MECFAKKNFIISLAIHKSPLGEGQWEPPPADELSHKVELAEVDRLVSAVHSPCAGTRNLAKEGSCGRWLQAEEVYFEQSGKRGLLLH